jgi:hypothetical protein
LDQGLASGAFHDRSAIDIHSVAAQPKKKAPNRDISSELFVSSSAGYGPAKIVAGAEILR